MDTVTLDQVRAEHERLGALIAKLSEPKPLGTLLRIPEAETVLAAGEQYAGLVLDAATGAPSHHLVLLPAEAKSVSWQAAIDWAKSTGGELPTRQEQALLYANCKRCFQEEWYWSAEQHATEGAYAWYQHFYNGNHYYNRKSYEGRARAVRRLPA